MQASFNARVLTFTAVLLTVSPTAPAAETLSKAMIGELIETTDTASRQRDTAAIGAALGSGFYKYIDVPSDGTLDIARIDKDTYLKLIDAGWRKLDSYQYLRKDTVIHVARDGASGESFSTVIETFAVEGQPMTSKVREYARYELEDGRPVIVNIDTQTLVGDTTPNHF